ncbi:MAG: hypothetical protein QXK71_01255 [Pyrobaculum sp.]
MSSTMRSRLLAILSGALSLLASLIFALTVSRRLPPEDLALLNIFNSAYAIGTSIASYITAWYPRVFAKDPAAYQRYFAAGLVVGFLGWASGVLYLLLYQTFDLLIFLLLAAMLALYVTPAAAYMSVHRQTRAAALGVVSQFIKIVGALFIRTHPTVYTTLLVNLLVALPPFLAFRKKPDFKKWRFTLKEALYGASFQTLTILTTVGGGLYLYMAYTAGGGEVLYLGYLLFQFSKMVYPALALAPLMYGSMLLEDKVERRALLDGALLLYIYIIASAVMLNTPAHLIALIRPQELANETLTAAMSLNAFALLMSGIFLHISNVLLAEEKKPILTLRDKAAKPLYFDIGLIPLYMSLFFYLVSSHGVVGLVAMWIVTSAVGVAVRLHYIYTKSILTKLYLPAIISLSSTLVLPHMYIEPRTSVGEAFLNVFIHAVYYGGFAAFVFTLLSQPAREIIRSAWQRACVLINSIR